MNDKARVRGKVELPRKGFKVRVKNNAQVLSDPLGLRTLFAKSMTVDVAFAATGTRTLLANSTTVDVVLAATGTSTPPTNPEVS